MASPSEHTQAVLRAAEAKDIPELQRLAWHEEGYVNNRMRERVWPLLLRCPETSVDDARRRAGSEIMDHVYDRPHTDEHQITLDVNRAFNGIKDITMDSDTLAHKRAQLQDLIMSVFEDRPALHYFQGYHDIASVFLLVLSDENSAKACLTQLSLHRIRDSMMPSLAAVLGYLRLMRRILKQASPSLAAQLEQASTLPYFSLSWVLTLLSHDIASIEVVARLFDAVLSQPPSFMLYIASAVGFRILLPFLQESVLRHLRQLVLIRSEQLIYMQDELAEDPALVHHSFSQLPKLVVKRPIPDKTEATADLYDPDVDVPALRMEKEPEETTVPIVEVLERARALQQRFPLDHPKIKISEIMGSKSVLYTFATDTLMDCLDDDEAESAIKANADIVIPEVEGVNESPAKPVLRRKSLFHTLFANLSPAQRLLFVGITGILLAVAGPRAYTFVSESGCQLFPILQRWLRMLRHRVAQ